MVESNSPEDGATANDAAAGWVTPRVNELSIVDDSANADGLAADAGGSAPPSP